MNTKSNPSANSRRKFIKSGMTIAASIPVMQFMPLKAAITNRRQEENTDKLYELFKNPPATAKPFVRWWWNGDKLSAKEILRELDVLKNAGIGGVEINPIAFPGGDDLGIPTLQWLSQEWIEMVKVALKGAEERGLICDIIVGSGWPFGTEILEGDDRSQLLTLSSRKVSGKNKITLNTEDVLNEAKPRVHAHKDADNKLYAVALAPVKMDKFQSPLWLPFDPESKSLEIDVPDGEYILYTLVKCTGFQAVINGAPGAGGPVLNHYSKEATEKFLNRMSNTLFPQIKDVKSFRALFCDSMELEGANWCNDYLEEFRRRRGYDIKPYLPFILFKVGGMGSKIDGGETTQLAGEAQETVNRARYDFYTTCMEIITNRFLVTYTQWCNRHGFKSRMQAYGNEFHPLEASLDIDIPECETWMWKKIDKETNTIYNDFVNQNSATNVNKFVASAARLSGKKVVSCEEITNTDNVFHTSLEQVKICGDQSNLSGVNHSILHGFNYSPLEAPFPGWVRYGTFFNERNPWWKYFNRWTAYKARLSSLLQETEAVADIAVMHPLADMWSIHGPQRDPFPRLLYPNYQYKVWEAIHKNGNGCDYTCESIIRKSHAENGYLKYGNLRYNTLILLEVETIQHETAKILAKFVASGGKLIFVAKEPHKSPGLVNHNKNDLKVANTISKIKKSYPNRTFTVNAPNDDVLTWFRGIQKQCGINPYIVIDKPDNAVSQIRHKTQGKDIFFISNASQTDTYKLNLQFPQSNGSPQEWNPETGERKPLPAEKTIHVELPPATSKLIIFDDSPASPLIGAAPEYSRNTGTLTLKGWTMRLEHIDGTSRTMEIDTPFDLSKDESTRSFAGYIYYEKKLGNLPDYKYLDLGEVYGVSEVSVDGTEIGNRWYGRHRYRLVENASGKTLKIKISTTVGNYLLSKPENHAHGWVRRNGLSKTGIAGEIKLTY